jgi:hypothetical protein
MSKTHLGNIQTRSFTVIWGKHELVPLLVYGERYYCCHSQETYIVETYSIVEMYSFVPEIAAYVLCTGLPMGVHSAVCVSH